MSLTRSRFALPMGTGSATRRLSPVTKAGLGKGKGRVTTSQLTREILEIVRHARAGYGQKILDMLRRELRWSHHRCWKPWAAGKDDRRRIGIPPEL
jgi:hypothetical protein